MSGSPEIRSVGLGGVLPRRFRSNALVRRCGYAVCLSNSAGDRWFFYPDHVEPAWALYRSARSSSEGIEAEIYEATDEVRWVESLGADVRTLYVRRISPLYERDRELLEGWAARAWGAKFWPRAGGQ